MKNFIFLILFFSCFIPKVFTQDLYDLSDSILLIKNLELNEYQLVESNKEILTLFYTDSTIMARGKFLKGKRNGNWSSFSSSGTIQTFGYITDSSFTGKWFFYHENGARKAKGKFTLLPCALDSTQLVLYKKGKWKFWNESGQLIFKSFFSPTLSNNKHQYGRYIERYDSGKRKIVGEYYKGSKIGNWTYFYENGVKRKTEFYQYNTKQTDYKIGNWSYFDDKGYLLKVEKYKNGKLLETITIDRNSH